MSRAAEKEKRKEERLVKKKEEVGRKNGKEKHQEVGFIIIGFS